MIKLDYTIESPEERNQLVRQILNQYDEPPNAKYLESLADYLILCMEKQEKKEKKILTENRLSTVGKRETSFEGLVSQFENGEDGIYSLITEDKNVIFKPKVSITPEDLKEIEPLRQLQEAIKIWEDKAKTASGRDAFIIRNTLIELRKDQYVIKNAYRRPIIPNKLVRSKYTLKLDDNTSRFDYDGYPIPEGISLMDPKVCEAILCNYSKLKEDSWDKFDGDTWYLIYDFERVCDRALAAQPLLARLLELKIDGESNANVQSLIYEEFGIRYTVEYISCLWRKKIPRLISLAAIDEYLDWYYLTQEKGQYKKCNRCGQIKLVHSRYFTKNNTSRDGFYSLCKICRNNKQRGENK